MIDRKKLFANAILGLGRTVPITVREAQWGYVIQSVSAGGPWRFVAERAARFATLAVWLAVIGLWLVPVPMLPQFAIALKIIASVVLLVLVYAGAALVRRIGGYAFHIDTNRREVRAAVLTSKGQNWIKTSYRFDEIGEAVLQRVNGSEDVRKLCLRLRKDSELVPVAVGDEVTLLGVHDRLMRDLRPIQDRMAAYGNVRLMARHPARQAVFPMLGPEEIAARRPRGASA